LLISEIGSFLISDYTSANLSFANLTNTYFEGSNFNQSNLKSANLTGTTFDYSDLTEADFSDVTLDRSKLIQSSLQGTILNNAQIGNSTLLNLDLSEARGLDTLVHNGSSIIDLSTMCKSKGAIPEVFLRGCGMSVEYLAALELMQREIRGIES